MFPNIYEVLKDFIAWLYNWAGEAAATLLGNIWLMLPEFVTEPTGEFLECVNIANHWFPVEEGFAMATLVMTFRVVLGTLRVIWRFTPLIGA